jgi:hypothetical protein
MAFFESFSMFERFDRLSLTKCVIPRREKEKSPEEVCFGDSIESKSPQPVRIQGKKFGLVVGRHLVSREGRCDSAISSSTWGTVPGYLVSIFHIALRRFGHCPSDIHRRDFLQTIGHALCVPLILSSCKALSLPSTNGITQQADQPLHTPTTFHIDVHMQPTANHQCGRCQQAPSSDLERRSADNAHDPHAALPNS